MKMTTLILTLLIGNYCLAGNGSSVHRVVITDSSYIEDLKVAVSQKTPVYIVGQHLIPEKIEESFNRYKLEGTTLEGRKSTVNIRLECEKQ